jgi:glycosyltransferase involved in cell wall biosynthesis
VILVGFPGQADVGVARMATLNTSCPVVLDAFVSLYETNVEDRRTTSSRSVAAFRYRMEDALSCRLAHRVLLDTDAHSQYFADHIGVPKSKLRRVWLGADDEVMRPQVNTPTGPFRAFFYGNFIPLHGLEHVVRAARLLEQAGEAVDFTVVGTGQTYAATIALCAELGVSSIRFLGPRRYEELPVLMAESHLCLGIFGTSGKAARVIPNKVFDALAVGCPVLTADTPAIREALTHGEHAWLCPPGDPASLADAIVALKADDPGRGAMAARGHDLFRRRFSLDALSDEVAGVLVDLL